MTEKTQIEEENARLRKHNEYLLGVLNEQFRQEESRARTQRWEKSHPILRWLRY